MTKSITTSDAAATSTAAIAGTADDLLLGDDWTSGLERAVRGSVRELIQEMLQSELAEALGRQRYKRLKSATSTPLADAARPAGLGDEVQAAPPRPAKGHRNGTRARTVMGTFGEIAVDVPRARLDTDEPGKTVEWQNKTIPRYQRRTKEVDALIAGAYLSGTNTRRAPHASGMTRRTRAGGAVPWRDLEVGGQPRVAEGMSLRRQGSRRTGTTGTGVI
jgi:transposase-like protein